MYNYHTETWVSSTHQAYANPDLSHQTPLSNSEGPVLSHVVAGGAFPLVSSYYRGQRLTVERF